MSLFNQINLETPESIELEFTLAGVGNRAYALVIDYILLGATLLLSLIIVLFLSYQVSVFDLLAGNRDIIIKWIWAIEILISFAIYVGYFVFFETIWQGQTPGKKRVHIRVVDDNGRPVNLVKTTLRALLRPIDDLSSIGVFLIIFTKREKRIGDLIAGTLVIQEEANIITTQVNDMSEQAIELATTLSGSSNISLLSPENFTILGDYLNRRNSMSKLARNDTARKLALQVQNIVELETIPENVTANLFIEAIYLAYQRAEPSR